jgi:hypothetical protein
LGIWVALVGAVAAADVAARGDGVAQGDVERGRGLFTTDCQPGDTARRSGDGLGPMYNDASCVPCRNEGGGGGAGSSGKKVDLVTAVVTPVADEPGHRNDLFSMRLPEFPSNTRARRGAAEPTKPRAKGEAPDRRPLIKLHAGFRGASSLVLHCFGSDADHEVRRVEILNPAMESLARLERSMFGGSDEAFLWLDLAPARCGTRSARE